MAATEAVFATVELLENIIVNIPAREIHSLKKVSSYWNQLIRSSPQIRSARCLKPITDPDRAPYVAYDRGARINFNLRLPSHRVEAYDLQNHEYLTYMDIPISVLQQLSVVREEYITSPRCPALDLCLRSYGSYGISCVLYVKDGIKINDLLHVMRKLWLSYEESLEGRIYLGRIYLKYRETNLS